MRKKYSKKARFRELIRLPFGVQIADEQSGSFRHLFFCLYSMKTKTLFVVSLLGIILATGAILSQGCPHVPNEVGIMAPIPISGPLRHVPAAAAGRVWEVYVPSGSQIKRGQVLAKLMVPLHTVSLQQAEREFQHIQQRYNQQLGDKSGQISSQVLEQTRKQLATARQTVASVPKQVTFVFIQAPVDGIVARVPAPSGTYVSDSSTVISIGTASASTFEVADN